LENFNDDRSKRCNSENDKECKEQLKYSYTPYSNFKIGSALLAKNGKIYTRCSVENASYTHSNCADRTAFFKAVSEGTKEFEAICIVGGQHGKIHSICPPCGVCLQVMMGFCDPETFQIILVIDAEDYTAYSFQSDF